jgi:hypothetical protein
MSNVYSQNSVFVGLGYQYPKVDASKRVYTNYPYTPHIWLGFSHQKDVIELGVSGFINYDRIQRTWPNQGKYTQTKKQFGIGILAGFVMPISEKHSAGFRGNLGVQSGEWNVSSSNNFLEESILPREEVKNFYSTIGIAYEYKLNKKIHLGALIGIGENNILISLKTVL